MEPELLSSAAGQIALDSLKLSLAQQVAPRRWRAGLARVVAEMDRGRPMEAAFEQAKLELPSELRFLMRESLKVPDPGRLIVDALRVRDEVRRSWQGFATLIAYPAILFAFALAVGVVFSYSIRNMIDFRWIEEFGLSGFETMLANLADQHHAVMGLAMATGWIVLVLLTILIVGPPWAPVAVMGGIVVVGRPLRWISLQEVLHRYRLFLEQGMGTIDAAEAVSHSFSRSSQAVVTRAMATRIRAGASIGQSACQSMLSDRLCRPALVLLDERGRDLVSALAESADLVGRLADQRCRTLGTILPVFILVNVGTIVWASVSAYLMGLMPLITMITSLA